MKPVSYPKTGTSGRSTILALAVGLASLSISVPAAAASDAAIGLSPGAGCSPASPAVFSPIASIVSSKASAILGNTVSSLDLIRQQQTPSQSQPMLGAILADAALLRPRLTPGIDASSAIRTECQPLVATRAIFPSEMGAKPVLPLNPEDFLASKRVRIAHTPFDSEWKRVKAEGISRSAVRRMVGTTSGDEGSTLAKVNGWVNHQITYTEDRDLFGVDDLWAGARRTLKLRKGDCEDIALLKMQMLAAAGIRREDMILTIARDLVRQADHAVLIVHTADGYRMLDNASDQVIDAAPRQDYRAIVSFGSKDTWLHGA